MLIKKTPTRATERGFLGYVVDNYATENECQAELDNAINYLKHRQGYFAIEELAGVLEKTGATREWLHTQIDKKLLEGSIYYDETRLRYDIMI